MFRKFVLWFIGFGLSFLSESLGWAEQGKAFMYIHLGIGVIAMLVHIACMMILSIKVDRVAEEIWNSILKALIAAVYIVIRLFVIWSVARFFNVEFFVTYQIVTFGQCLCLCESAKKNND